MHNFLKSEKSFNLYLSNKVQYYSGFPSSRTYGAIPYFAYVNNFFRSLQTHIIHTPLHVGKINSKRCCLLNKRVV